MIIISDTSPVANLIVVKQLVLLQKVFDEIIIPDKVYAEILNLEKFNYNLGEFKTADWIIRKSITDISAYNQLIKSVDEGEAEAITLAKEMHTDFLLIDEKKGRIIAHQFGIKTVGLLGVLLKAKKKKYIADIKSILDTLREEANFWISEELYSEMLRLAGE